MVYDLVKQKSSSTDLSAKAAIISNDGSKICCFKRGDARRYQANGTTKEVIPPALFLSDRGSGRQIQLQAPDHEAVAACFSDDGLTLLTGHEKEDYRIRIWNALDGTLAGTFDGHQKEPDPYGEQVIGFLRDQKTIVSVTRDQTLFWDVESQSVLCSHRDAFVGELTKNRYLLGTNLFVAEIGPISDKSDVVSKSIPTFDGKLLVVRKPRRSFEDVREGIGFSPDGKFIAILQHNSSAVVIYDILSDELVVSNLSERDLELFMTGRSTLTEQKDYFHDRLFSLAALTKFDNGAAKELRANFGNANDEHFFSPDCSVVTVFGVVDRTSLYKLKDSKYTLLNIEKLLDVSSGVVEGVTVVYSPDSRFLSIQKARQLGVWDCTTNRLCKFVEANSHVIPIGFNEQASMFGVLLDKSLQWFDTATWTVIDDHVIQGTTDNSPYVPFGVRGRLLSDGERCFLQVSWGYWLVNPKAASYVKVELPEEANIEFANDDFVIYCVGNKVVLRDTSRSQNLIEIEEADSQIVNCRVDPTGRYVATILRNGRLSIWDLFDAVPTIK